jgi:hypothetical protein
LELGGGPQRQRNQGTAFRDSPEFHRLVYREVKSPNLFAASFDRLIGARGQQQLKNGSHS